MPALVKVNRSTLKYTFYYSEKASMRSKKSLIQLSLEFI